MFIPPPHFYRQNIFLHIVVRVLRTRSETANTIRETGDFEKYLITAVGQLQMKISGHLDALGPLSLWRTTANTQKALVA